MRVNLSISLPKDRQRRRRGERAKGEKHVIDKVNGAIC